MNDEAFRAAQQSRKQAFAERGIPIYECPDCGMVTPNPDDVANEYCPRCHEFKKDKRDFEQFVARLGLSR